jgi:nondiscriminating glutamyl-tRNA synthetase
MRVRFAPSPTGFLHVGNARTAIINYLIAKKNNAAMVLRIEDTDRERSSTESERSIMRDLSWLGIEWEEGPDRGGGSGPYRQSERLDIYRSYTDRLLSEKKAYHCYCTREELEQMKKGAGDGPEAYEYNGRCRFLTEAQKKEFEREGRRPTVRFTIPDNQTVIVKDLIKGDVEFNTSNIGGDFIIVRSDGMPVFNYIVIIDDALMGISHVIRGDDHLSNTPKQILIARSLGLPEPAYAHHTLILGPDRSKLSKRHGITSVETYRTQGYLPEALFNYLAMLGWAADGGEEILDRGRIIDQIELSKLSKSSPVFDFQKLRWMNGEYIRSCGLGEITERFIPHVEKAGYSLAAVDRKHLEDIISVLRRYCDLLSDMGGLIGIFLDEVCVPNEEADAMLRTEEGLGVISAAYGLTRGEIDESGFLSGLPTRLKEATSFKGKSLFMPLRAMLTGRLKGPELDQALPLIGFDKCKKRIEYCYERYGAHQGRGTALS